MENASKALLIAGAVLICIVLISVGMIIVNSTSDVTDQVGEIASTQAAQSFNSQFSKYAGQQKGSSVKALLETIATSNATSPNDITVVWTNGNLNTNASATITGAMSNLVNTTTYTVKITGMANDTGFITQITITP